MLNIIKHVNKVAQAMTSLPSAMNTQMRLTLPLKLSECFLEDIFTGGTRSWYGTLVLFGLIFTTLFGLSGDVLV